MSFSFYWFLSVLIYLCVVSFHATSSAWELGKFKFLHYTLLSHFFRSASPTDSFPLCKTPAPASVHIGNAQHVSSPPVTSPPGAYPAVLVGRPSGLPGESKPKIPPPVPPRGTPKSKKASVNPKGGTCGVDVVVVECCYFDQLMHGDLSLYDHHLHRSVHDSHSRRSRSASPSPSVDSRKRGLCASVTARVSPVADALRKSGARLRKRGKRKKTRAPLPPVPNIVPASSSNVRTVQNCYRSVYGRRPLYIPEVKLSGVDAHVDIDYDLEDLV